MSAVKTRLSLALRVSGPTLLYAVDRIPEAIAAVEAAIGEVDPLDGARPDLRARCAERKDAGAPIVMILERPISPVLREVLSELADLGVQVIAISSAPAPSEEMWALFPLRLAAVRALEVVR